MPGHRPSGFKGLSTQLADLAPIEGLNSGAWPGLMTYRFSGPASWVRERVQPLSLVVVARGRHRVTVDGMIHEQGPLQCLTVSGHSQMVCEVLDASVGHPYVCVVVEIDPDVVRHVASDMLDWTSMASRHSRGSARTAERACAHELLEVVHWAIHNIATDMDGHLLGPMYEREMIYWLLQSERGDQLRALASGDSATTRVSTVIEYARTHLAEPLSNRDMADLANLSPSAFAHQFRDVTGRPPHQFVKEMRLSHARELLADGDLTIARISREVGYASASQFISAFRSRFGMTPARARQRSR